MQNRNQNERGGVHRNQPGSQQDRESQRNRPQNPGGAQEPGTPRKPEERHPQDPKQGDREGGGSKGSQSNWSPGRTPTDGEDVTPPTDDEDRDRGGRGRMQQP